MKKIYLLLVSIFACGALQAQYAGGGVPNSAAIGGQTNAVSARVFAQLLGSIDDAENKRKELELSSIQGSPYTSNQFASTTLFYGEDKVRDVYYRYNALNEEIEVKKTLAPEEGYRALAKDKNINIRVEGNKLAFNTFITSKNRTLNGYLAELYKGKEYTLYKRIMVKYTEGQDAQNSFVAAIPARFTQFTEYYFKKKGVNRIDQIQQKNGKFLKQLAGDMVSDMKNYLKENDLNLKNEYDLIKVFEFLDKK